MVVAAPLRDAVVGFGGCMSMLASSRARLRVVVTGGAPGPGAAPSDAPLAWLGALRAEVVRLDGSRPEEVVRRLPSLVRGFDLCAAPWCGDRGSDPGAARWAALLACSLRLRPPLVEYWVPGHRCAPTACEEPWQRAERVALPPGAADSKRWALDAGRGPLPGSDLALGASAGRCLGAREILFL
ncbi:hypothetical protein [Streptomyces sp. NRRL S-350]|uniref:hypothetical protein n=1 Tax=Streptomyces sp. NRRL S-350 TaxID=1463902 RepID=UPI00068AD01F|nr:hypothetical protein [Streptomyces sp. NRRL S-350]